MRGTVGILTGKGPACDGLQAWVEREIPQPALGFQPDVQVLRVPGNQIAWQRNHIVHQMRPDDDFIFFVDADCIPPVGALRRLLSHGVGVVGALNIERVAPFNACAVRSLEPFERYRGTDFPAAEREIRQVVSVGTGCTLIRRRVFEAMPAPWFRVGQLPGAEDLLAEDLFFCLKAAEVGFPVYLDPGVRPGHETKVILYAGDAEVTGQFEGPVGPLPYRVPLPVEDLRELHL